MLNHKPTFDIILVSWNRLAYLKQTVASLINSGAWKSCERFIIVDNHSTEEGVKEFLDTMLGYQKVFVIRRPQNDGWASAVNDALGLSRSEYVFLSNNDVTYDPDFIEKMFDTMIGHDDVGLLGAWRHTAHSVIETHHNDKNGDFVEMTDIPAVAWLLDKQAMAEVGMLEEHGPCFTKGGNGEDTKYVQMMKAKGWKTGVTAEDVAHHIDGY